MKKNRDHLVLFIAITLAWTWIGGLFPLFLNSVDDGTKDLLFKLIAGPAPSITGIAIVLLTYTKLQKRDYFRRAFHFKQMGIKWPLLTTAFNVIILGVTIFVSVNFMGGAVPEFEAIHTIFRQPYMLLWFLFFGIMSGPFNEEFGWRGFALDRLLARFGFFVGGTVIMGVIWGIWHLPWYFFPGNAQYIWWQMSPIHGMVYILHTVMLSGVVTVVYIKTNRSIMAGAFVHLISNIFAGMLVYPFDDAYMLTMLYVKIVLDGLVVLYFARNRKFQDELKHQISLIKNDFQ